MKKLSYIKLREILKSIIKTEKFTEGLNNLSKEGTINIADMLRLFEELNADIIILNALADKPLDELEPDEGVEILAAFFTAIKSSASKLSSLAESLNLQAPKANTLSNA